MATERSGPETPVVFRFWKGKTGGVLALFPAIPADNSGALCSSYERVGQHGGADYHGCIRRTRPATPQEYQDLAKELQGLGYNLKVYRRATQEMHRERIDSAKP